MTCETSTAQLCHGPNATVRCPSLPLTCGPRALHPNAVNSAAVINRVRCVVTVLQIRLHWCRLLCNILDMTSILSNDQEVSYLHQ